MPVNGKNSIQNYTACEELNSFHFQVMSIILDIEPGFDLDASTFGIHLGKGN